MSTSPAAALPRHAVLPASRVAFVAGQLVIFALGLAGLKIAVGESWSPTIHNAER